MPTRAWFPTFIYSEPLRPGSAARFNVGLADECRRLRDYDDAGSIGRRYRRQDEVGTPFCVTVDVDTLEDGAVTVRDRDSMTQERIPVEGVKRAILDRMEAARAG